ncbi:MAG: phenylalanine--tRNA ligase subunit alpha [Myxococcota bacterium]|nr:phenylalanine--tRNA ligase subunit alpha [Myxococcota bacterium]
MREGDPTRLFDEGLARVEGEYEAAFAAALDEPALRAAAARYIGPNGELTQLLRQVGSLPAESRRAYGARANTLRQRVEHAFEQALAQLRERERRRALDVAPVDPTLPGRWPRPGRLHPTRRALLDVVDVFTSMGFDVADGPEVDRAEYNFDRLGFPPDHPATDMHDSFFVRGGEADRLMLRTHTSTIQVREMMRRRPPLAVVAPGVVYRRDDDATHSPMFFQIEGFLVDRDVSMADLRGVLTVFGERLFGAGTPLRLRPSYFPFVEPGAEADLGCTFCRPWEQPAGARPDCRVCKGSGWLEILGCGMIHPVVFENVGIDPETWTGFAFGMGIDRIAMLRHGIPSIRMLFDNDPRLLGSL